jgi:hypothetical protein
MHGNYDIDDGLLTAGVNKHAKDGLPGMSYLVLRHTDIQLAFFVFKCCRFNSQFHESKSFNNSRNDLSTFTKYRALNT